MIVGRIINVFRSVVQCDAATCVSEAWASSKFCTSTTARRFNPYRFVKIIIVRTFKVSIIVTVNRHEGNMGGFLLPSSSYEYATSSISMPCTLVLSYIAIMSIGTSVSFLEMLEL